MRFSSGIAPTNDSMTYSLSCSMSRIEATSVNIASANRSLSLLSAKSWCRALPRHQMAFSFRDSLLRYAPKRKLVEFAAKPAWTVLPIPFHHTLDQMYLRKIFDCDHKRTQISADPRFRRTYAQSSQASIESNVHNASFCLWQYYHLLQTSVME